MRCRARAKCVARRRRLALRSHTREVISAIIVGRPAEAVEGISVFL